jgi:hypothetical protein
LGAHNLAKASVASTPRVIITLRNTVQPRTDRSPLRQFFVLLSLFFALVLSASAQSAPPENTLLDDALRQLADRVAAVPLRGPVRLEFFEDANFVADTSKEWEETFRKELEKHRMTVTQDQSATLVRAGLAETPTELVLTASVRYAEKDEVRVVSLPRASFRSTNLPVVPVRIEKQWLYESGDRILDASSLRNGTEAGLVVLAERDSAVTVLLLDASGALKQSISLASAVVRPSRDLRAELAVRADGANVLFPGKTCQFTWSASADPKCHATKSNWRDPTVLTPTCDAGSWKLQADGTDWTTPDLLHVLPIDSSRKGSSGMFSDLPGPVLSINGEQNPASALVVTRNLRTGNYEVYRITLACGN